MKEFEEFIEQGTIKHISPNINRSQSLLIEAKRKLALLQINIEKLGITDENANDFIEYCYNIIMYYIRSEMFLRGYATSGDSAHEAEVSFTKHLDFTMNQTKFLDQLRYFRNGILYYGKQFDEEYAQKVIDFTNKIGKGM